jgi:hypothetical protein
VGGVAQKKPRSVCPHTRQRSQCKECGGGASARTRAKGTDARSAGGRAFARNSAKGAYAKSAGGRASASTSTRGADATSAGVRTAWHLPAQAPKEPMQGVWRGKHLPAPARTGECKECGGRACARTIASEADARGKGRLRACDWLLAGGWVWGGGARGRARARLKAHECILAGEWTKMSLPAHNGPTH